MAMKEILSSNFLKISYWFDLQPGTVKDVGLKMLLGLFALALLFGVVMKFFQKRFESKEKLRARIFRKLSNLGITMGIFGFFLLFFWYEEIYIFSARFWLILWGGVSLFWLAKVVHLAKVKIPKEQSSLSDRAEFEKYLPAKK
jgi:hypothetical protein